MALKDMEDIWIKGAVEHRKVSFQMTIDDIFAVSKGVLVGRPAK